VRRNNKRKERKMREKCEAENLRHDIAFGVLGRTETPMRTYLLKLKSEPV